MRDVIIVGGGPAGTSLAKELAEKDWDVAVYEKRQEIGAPKRCGEGFSSSSMKELGLNIPKNCVRRPIKGAKVFAPNGKMIGVEFNKDAGYILERKMFDKWLAAEASRAGAKIQAKTKITDIIFKKGEVEVKGESQGEEFKEKAKMVVGADGVESLCTRKSGLRMVNKAKLMDSGYQLEMSNIDIDYPDDIVLYFGNKIAPRGYVWIFPKGEDTANVGIGVSSLTKESAKYYLNKFLEKNSKLNGSVLEVNSGLIPVGGFLKQLSKDNFLAIGDAAHQVNPIHGGGMAEAIKASKIAADVIHKGLKKDDLSRKVLKEYDRRWWEERGKKLKKIEKLREVMENLSDEDFNYLAKYLEGKDMVEFSKGNKLFKIGKLLFKKPKLAKKLYDRGKKK